MKSNYKLQLSCLALLLTGFIMNTNAQLHQPLSCSSNATSGQIDWSSNPSGNSQYNWLPQGSLSNVFTDVSGTGVDVSFSFAGETNTFGMWGANNTPSVGFNPTGGAEECLELYTNGFNNGISITLDFSVSVSEIAFDLANMNSIPGFNGDFFTITAINELGQVVYPTFTESANPSYVTDNIGNIDAVASSTAGDNDEVGVNLGDPNNLVSFTVFWGNCTTCSPNFVHGLGIKDVYFCAADNDNDELIDFIDIDDDNDGIPDLVETFGNDPLADNDGDGVYAYIDDNDNDPNVFNANGIVEAFFDFDGDNVANHLDLDADNDGIADITEADGTDVFGDGQVAYQTPGNPITMVDIDNDGLADEYDSSISPFVTMTEDGDCSGQTVGYTHNVVYQTGTLDAITNVTLTFCLYGDYGNGVTESIALSGENGTLLGSFSKFNSNNPNYGDCQTAAMCITTTIPQALWNIWNNDGTVELSLTPSNAVNFCSVYSCLESATVSYQINTNPGTDIPLTDTDGESLPNYLDLDSDNDGLGDNTELNGGSILFDLGGGSVLDGMVGPGFITDLNFNGWSDADEGTDARTDVDGDGIPDVVDVDSDNDGIRDVLEATCTFCSTFGASSVVDSDNDGFSDQFEGLNAQNNNGGSNQGIVPNEDNDDGDAVPDYLDTDSDADTAFDWSEGYDSDGNGNALPEIPGHAQDYALAGGNPTDYPLTDSDADGLPDFADNQPFTPSYIESIRPPFLDPSSTYWVDADNDGLVDLLDTDINGEDYGTEAPLPNSDQANDRDWRDPNSVVYLPIELVEFTANKEGRQVHLTWETSTEVNNDFFTVYRSQDLETWIEVGVEDGAGSTSQTQYYQMFDNEPFTGVSYYQLKQTDFDGKTSLSEIRSVNIEMKEESISVFPNPVVNQLNVTNQSSQEIVVTLIASSGQELDEVVLTSQASKAIDMSRYAAGMYAVIVNFASGKIERRNIVKY